MAILVPDQGRRHFGGAGRRAAVSCVSMHARPMHAPWPLVIHLRPHLKRITRRTSPTPDTGIPRRPDGLRGPAAQQRCGSGCQHGQRGRRRGVGAQQRGGGPAPRQQPAAGGLQPGASDAPPARARHVPCHRQWLWAAAQRRAGLPAPAPAPLQQHAQPAAQAVAAARRLLHYLSPSTINSQIAHATPDRQQSCPAVAATASCLPRRRLAAKGVGLTVVAAAAAAAAAAEGQVVAAGPDGGGGGGGGGRACGGGLPSPPPLPAELLQLDVAFIHKLPYGWRRRPEEFGGPPPEAEEEDGGEQQQQQQGR